MEQLRDKGTLFAIIMLGAVAAQFFNFLPITVGAVVDSMGLDEKQMSYFASSDLVGYSITSITSVFWIRKYSWKLLAIAFISIAIIGNLSSLNTTSYIVLMFSRVVCGIGEGGLAALAMAGIGASVNPEKNMSIFLFILTAISVVGLFVLPNWTSTYGAVPIFLLFIGLFVFLFILVLALVPKALKLADTTSDFHYRNLFKEQKVITCLIGFLILYIGVGTFWAFAERQGVLGGLEADFIAYSIAIALLISILGTLIPVWLGLRIGRFIPIVVSILLMSLSGYLVFIVTTEFTFGIGIGLFYIFWSVLLAYMMGILSSVDTKNFGAGMLPSMFALGSALGPFIASFFISSTTLQPAFWILVISITIAGTLYIVVNRNLTETT
ncbi:MAG: MFS transporter [Bacteroidia bacterium]|nr:MFS transporter [Bacteroidia bacterium]